MKVVCEWSGRDKRKPRRSKKDYNSRIWKSSRGSSESLWVVDSVRRTRKRSVTESRLVVSNRWTRKLVLAMRIGRLLASALLLDSQAQPFFWCVERESYFYFLLLCVIFCSANGMCISWSLYWVVKSILKFYFYLIGNYFLFLFYFIGRYYLFIIQ